jgi:transposase
MPVPSLHKYLLLPELRLVRTVQPRFRRVELHAEKVSEMEVCPRCATPSRSVYDRRKVALKDDPVRGESAWLIVTKRRFHCRPCGKPFTEPVQGVRKGYRTTERYRQRLHWLCERFSDLSQIRKDYRCSAGLLYRILYERVELRISLHRDHPFRSVVITGFGPS